MLDVPATWREAANMLHDRFGWDSRFWDGKEKNKSA